MFPWSCQTWSSLSLPPRHSSSLPTFVASTSRLSRRTERTMSFITLALPMTWRDSSAPVPIPHCATYRSLTSMTTSTGLRLMFSSWQILVTVDDIPAALYPTFPWIFTGGIDPYLWRPLPSVRTLQLQPTRLDLTPFAPLLSSNCTLICVLIVILILTFLVAAHLIDIAAVNASCCWGITANLFLFLDKSSSQVLIFFNPILIFFFVILMRISLDWRRHRSKHSDASLLRPHRRPEHHYGSLGQYPRRH